MALDIDSRYIGHYNENVDAVVLQADANNFILKTKDGQILTNPLIITPYFDPNSNANLGGVGLFGIPKRGSIYNVGFDRFGAPHVLGAVMNEYPNLIWKQFNPGDIVLIGALGNRIRFADAGFIELFSSPLCAIRTYQSNNRMEILAQRMDITTDELEFTADKDIKGTLINLKIKDQPNAFPTGNIVNISVANSVKDIIYKTILDKSGSYSLQTKKDIKLTSPKVELGPGIVSDPAVLGNENKRVLTDIYQTMSDILQTINVMATALNSVAPGTSAAIAPNNMIVQKDLLKMKLDMQTVLSKAVTLV